MDEPLVETEVADSEPQRRSGPWKLIIVVVVLTLIGVWLIPADDSTDEPVTAEDPGASGQLPSLLGEQPVDHSTPAPAPEMAEEAAEPAVVDDRPGAKARALIAEMRSAGAIDLDQMLAAAAQAQTDGELANAYLLYFFASWLPQATPAQVHRMRTRSCRRLKTRAMPMSTRPWRTLKT